MEYDKRDSRFTRRSGDLFDETRIGYDLREGVLWNPAKTRLCLLSTDFITGVYKAVKDEAAQLGLSFSKHAAGFGASASCVV